MSKLWNLEHKNQMRKYYREYHQKNRDRILRRMKSYSASHREESRARQRQYYARKRDKINASRYGLLVKEYLILISQPCGICGTTERRRFPDHNHVTKKIRGALCGNCNRWYGFFEKLGEQTIQYFRRTQ